MDSEQWIALQKNHLVIFKKAVFESCRDLNSPNILLPCTAGFHILNYEGVVEPLAFPATTTPSSSSDISKVMGCIKRCM